MSLVTCLVLYYVVLFCTTLHYTALSSSRSRENWYREWTLIASQIDWHFSCEKCHYFVSYYCNEKQFLVWFLPDYCISRYFFFELVSSSKQGRWHSKQMCHSLHMGWEIPFNILLLLNIKIPMSIHVSTQLPRSLMIFEVTLLFSDKIFRSNWCLTLFFALNNACILQN